MPSVSQRFRRRMLAALGSAGLAAKPLSAEPARAVLSADGTGPGGGYVFSPVNQYGVQRTTDYWSAIIGYVARRTRLNLQLKVGRTTSDTTSFVLAREVDLVFTNHLFSPARDSLGWRVLVRRDAPAVSGQIAVLERSPINDLAQLAGAGVAFTGAESLIGYKLPYAHLLGSGVRVRTIFTGSLEAAMSQLLEARVQALGANSAALAAEARRRGLALRILWSSEPMPDLAVMASPRVGRADAQALTEALVGMNGEGEGRRILEQCARLVGLPSGTGFVRADGSEYAAYRRFYLTAPPALR